MKRQGNATRTVLVAAGVLLVAAIAFGIWWQQSTDPVEAQCVTDAEGAVTAYWLKQTEPPLGNFERLTGAGFHHGQHGTPSVRALTASRVAHFTKGESGVKAESLLELIIVPAGSGDDTAKVAVKAVEANGTRFILTHPSFKAKG